MPISVQSSRPARTRAAIVFAADGLYARFAFLAAEALRELHPDAPFDICLADLAMPEAPPASLEHLDVRRLAIDPGDTFGGLRLDGGHTQVVYLRIALPEALAGDYDRILYLDSDILIQGGDFASLLATDLLGRPLGAVRDNTQWRTPSRRPRQFRILGLSGAPYFNSGLLLFDVAAWREGRVLERACELGRRESARLIRHDQNLMNAVLRGGWAELHPAWNWQYTRASNLLEPMADPNVLHFISPAKPWKDRGGAFPPRFRRRYRGFLARHWPDDPPVGPDGPSPVMDRALMRAALYRQAMGLGRFQRFLARFPDRQGAIAPVD
jgi:hypothetical protein